MPGSELFWSHFTEVLGISLGLALGLLPLLLGVYGGLWLLLRGLRREAATPPTDARLRDRLAYLEARVLPMDEARRQREGR